MDGVTLDGLIAEMSPFVIGRHLGRPRLAGPSAVVFEVSGQKDLRLWLDAGRGTAGPYRLTRKEARELERLAAGEVSGRTRQALLLFRKYVDGARVSALGRVPGERTLALGSTSGLLVLRISGPAPALTLVVGGAPVATIGDGPAAWPLPAPAPEREWDRVEAARLAAAAAVGDRPTRAVLAACPSLGPHLARELDGSAGSLEALRARLRSPRPTLRAPGPPDAWHDRDLAPADAVTLLPIPLEGPGRTIVSFASFADAAALFLRARLRGRRFEREQRSALEGVRRRLRRLAQLEAHLRRDREGFPEAARLRREAEALLAAPGRLAPGAEAAELPDPYEPERVLRVRVDPRLTAPANADRLFEKARRIERARRQVETRLREAKAELTAERAREARLVEARDVAELVRPEAAASPGEQPRRGPRHYLTTKGLSLLVGRGARENHQITFGVARPEDLWLHARDVPGSHVILRDGEGRAGADDFREAAEVAAFFSEARGEGQVDVHVTRRKHLRPARGGAGRVVIGHSETLRVAPRDPEGRLRRR